jgi:2-alkyl-3-oxoalkanoate reductase
MLGIVKKRQMPVIDGGTGIWSFTEVTDAAAAAVTRGAPGWHDIVASWRDGFPVWVRA